MAQVSGGRKPIGWPAVDGLATREMVKKAEEAKVNFLGEARPNAQKHSPKTTALRAAEPNQPEILEFNQSSSYLDEPHQDLYSSFNFIEEKQLIKQVENLNVSPAFHGINPALAEGPGMNLYSDQGTNSLGCSNFR